MKIYGIKDKGQGFAQIYMEKSNYNALRSFNDLINSTEKNVVQLHPGDFSLFELGEFNQETGEISPKVKFIEEAVTLAPKKA